MTCLCLLCIITSWQVSTLVSCSVMQTATKTNDMQETCQITVISQYRDTTKKRQGLFFFLLSSRLLSTVASFFSQYDYHETLTNTKWQLLMMNFLELYIDRGRAPPGIMKSALPYILKSTSRWLLEPRSVFFLLKFSKSLRQVWRYTCRVSLVIICDKKKLDLHTKYDK